MLVKYTGKIVDIWKSKEDGWCIKTRVNREFFVTYIHLNKPKKAIGATIRKGTKI